MYCISIKSRIFLHSWGRGAGGFTLPSISHLHFTIVVSLSFLSLLRVDRVPISSGWQDPGVESYVLHNPRTQISDTVSRIIFLAPPPHPPRWGGGARLIWAMPWALHLYRRKWDELVPWSPYLTHPPPWLKVAQLPPPSVVKSDPTPHLDFRDYLGFPPAYI